MVSIGLPEKARALIDHLQLESFGTQDKLFVDDVNNTIYDALELNRGLQRTFFNPATPFSFLDRIVRPSGDGFQDLGLVLSKWNNGTSWLHCFCHVHLEQKLTHSTYNFSAIFVPPKQAQALLQGGTFVFRGNDTLYAHYDPSTAAHAPMDRVIEIVTG
jgi:AhpC/TSA antioxidant enzyme